jgi:hypothetical protein
VILGIIRNWSNHHQWTPAEIATSRSKKDMFQAYERRLHWGKMNTFTSEQATEAYPFSMTFTLSIAQDPVGVF